MRTSMLMAGFFLGLAGVVPGCVGDGAGSDCPPGGPGCVCVAANLCATGLTCVSGYCVDLDSSGSGENGGTGEGDPSGDGDADGVNLCELLIDCAKEVQPEALSSYVTLYGPEGECFDIAGLSEQDCWAECDAIRDSLAMLNPDVAECGSYNCGDGKLDLDEMCDGTEGCTATCRYSTTQFNANECSPVTQAGCDTASSRCGFSDADFESQFYCLDNLEQQPAVGRSEDCGWDSNCIDTNALCLPRPDCISGACCTNTCYLGATDESFGGCPAGYTCTPLPALYGSGWPEGSELVGVCW